MLLFALPISNSTPHRDASQSRSNKRRGFTPYTKRAKVKHSSSSESISPANQLQVVLSLHRGPCHVFSVLADPFSLRQDRWLTRACAQPLAAATVSPSRPPAAKRQVLVLLSLTILVLLTLAVCSHCHNPDLYAKDNSQVCTLKINRSDDV
jgi:hypothetical protein